MVDDVEALEHMERDRAAAAELILGSSHPLRVVVAGPGTGKTYVFKEALERAGGPGLALTFIRRLAVDLADQLGAKAETYTFHKFAKMLVYRLAVPGSVVQLVEEQAGGAVYRVMRRGEPAGHVWLIHTWKGPAWLDMGSDARPTIEAITAAIRRNHPRCVLTGSGA